MPPCGFKMAALLSLPDGRDEHNPCAGFFGSSLWCGEADVSDWRARADMVSNLVRKEWNRLVDTGTGYHEEVRKITSDYESAYDVLPDASWSHAFGMDGAAVAVDQLVDNVRYGACVLEKIEDQLAKAGEHTITPGKNLTKDPGKIPSFLWVAALAGALWVLFGMPGIGVMK